MKDLELTANTLVDFLKIETHSRGLEGAILGLSGGIDSATVALLCKRAFKDSFKAILMPSASSSKSSIYDAIELCMKNGIKYEIIDISGIVTSYFGGTKDVDKMRIGNFCARVRMSILYDNSYKHSYLVVGTSNKSEIMLGYGTIHGDIACSINPIGNLYKCDVYKLAKYLGVTKAIIEKKPSAELYEGQNDEDELGFSYADIDKFLIDYVDNKIPKEELTNIHGDKIVDSCINRIIKNSFKRELPKVASI